jgi:undecaprenyl pyrophosphate synthase
MTTIDDLAQTIATQYDIPTDAARDLVAVYVDQINDDADLWNREDETLTAEGVEVVTTAISEGYARKLWSTAEANMLGELDDVTAELIKVAERQTDLTERRDQLVRSLMATSVSRDEIAAAARLKVARLYQIRDGRR